MSDTINRHGEDAPQTIQAPADKSGEVFYRKYRFSSFNDMCGQQQVASFFINTIKYNKISHAYLFSGPRGTGKTSMARLFAKILNCSGKTSYEPCGVCRNCVEFDRGAAVDIIEMDAASNRKIDDIRSLRDDVAFMPVNGRYKIFILDEAHMLTTEAANAFLKTLEEPPPYVIFILATTEHHKIPATILSRCQSVKFSRIAAADIVKRLEFVMTEENSARSSDKIKYERSALFLIAKKAAGGMRDALSLLEYSIALGAGEPLTAASVERILGIHSTGQIKNFIESIRLKNAAAGLEIIKKNYDSGSELISFLESLNSCISSLLLIKLGVTSASFFDCDEDDIAGLKETASAFKIENLMYLLDSYSECLSQIRFISDQKAHFEYVYIKTILNMPQAGAKETQTARNPESAADGPPVSERALISRISAIIDDKISALAFTGSDLRCAARPAGSAAIETQKQPATTASSTAVKKDGPALTLERIKLIWNSSYLGCLKEISIPTLAIISSGIPVRYCGGILELDFTKNAFCGERITTGAHLKYAAEAFVKTYNENVEFKIILPAREKAARLEERKKEILEEKKNDPMVQKILQAFDGEIIDVEEN